MNPLNLLTTGVVSPQCIWLARRLQRTCCNGSAEGGGLVLRARALLIDGGHGSVRASSASDRDTGAGCSRWTVSPARRDGEGGVEASRLAGASFGWMLRTPHAPAAGLLRSPQTASLSVGQSTWRFTGVWTRNAACTAWTATDSSLARLHSQS